MWRMTAGDAAEQDKEELQAGCVQPHSLMQIQRVHTKYTRLPALQPYLGICDSHAFTCPEAVLTQLQRQWRDTTQQVKIKVK
jgi:hypothetical protein